MKKYLLFLFIIPLFTSCEIDCPAFDTQSKVLSIALFPQELERYDFINLGNTLLRFAKSEFEESEAYTKGCGSPGNSCNCDTWRTAIYSSEDIELSIADNILVEHRLEVPEKITIQYYTRKDDDFQSSRFRFDIEEIEADIDALITPQQSIMNETFTNLVRIDLDDPEISLIIEKDRGLQGIIYEGELFKRIN